MYLIRTEQSFDAAHFLAGYEGKCRNIHGHRWRVVAEACSDGLQEEGQLRGMVMDFGDIRQDLGALTEQFDHALVYEAGTLREKTEQALLEEDFSLVRVPFRPTAENFAKHFFEGMKQKGYQMKAVTVYETPNNCASYCE